MPEDIRSKLGWNVYKVDAVSHIQVEQSSCRAKCPAKYCTQLCPARVYTLDSDGSIHIEHDACLECGTCTIFCQSGALTWHFPRAGHGIQYRCG